MKNIELQKERYETPKCECFEVVNEGVLCASDIKMESGISNWDDTVYDNQTAIW